MSPFNPFSKFLKPKADNKVIFDVKEQNEEARKKAAKERGLKENVS
jgi:hypothetical protein